MRSLGVLPFAPVWLKAVLSIIHWLCLRGIDEVGIDGEGLLGRSGNGAGGQAFIEIDAVEFGFGGGIGAGAIDELNDVLFEIGGIGRGQHAA